MTRLTILAVLCAVLTAQAAGARPLGKVRLEQKLGRDSTVFALKVAESTLKPGKEFQAIVSVHLSPSWHVYSSQNSEDIGVTALEVHLPDTLASFLELVGVEEKGELHTKYDENFEAEVKSYESDFQVLAKLRVKDAAVATRLPLSLLVTYGACSGALCLPPRTFAVPMTVDCGKKASTVGEQWVQIQ